MTEQPAGDAEAVFEPVPVDAVDVVDELAEPIKISARAILIGSGPRFARDAFGPVLCFYLGYKLAGLAVGIAAATAADVRAVAGEDLARDHEVVALSGTRATLQAAFAATGIADVTYLGR